MPVIISTKGYGFFFNTYSLSSFHDDEQGSYFWTDVDDEMDFFFMYGPEFDTLVGGMRFLTGEASMLPIWAFGYWQSREHYKSRQELLDVVAKHREKGIPIDGIVQDWKYWPGEQWGEKRFDLERYPDPEKMLRELHDNNVRLMISVWPNFGNSGPNHVTMRENGFLLENDCTLDVFNPKARELYWKQTNDGLYKYGIDGWWCDCTEPFDGMRPYRMREPYCKKTFIDTQDFKRYIDPEYINQYPLLVSQMMYEGQRSVTEEKRLVNLTRACYPGQQRYGTIVWSGDVAATWEVLRRHIADCLNFCVTGHSYWTMDVGAFFVFNRREDCWWHSGDYTDGVNDKGYQEIYVRWFQFGAFLPMFRSHGTDINREMWCFGNPGDVIYDTLMKFDLLRYRLLPYIYSVAGMVTHNRYTMVRSLLFDFREDPDVFNINDQYMFGPAIMVCPVTAPMYWNAGSEKLEGREKSRQVYLPKGCDWYDFWTGNKYRGGQNIIAEAPLEIIPLYVKSGSIIPLGPKVQYAQEIQDAPWELRIYPGSSGKFGIYEDAGDGYMYEKGEYSWTDLKWDDQTGMMNISERRGCYDGMFEEREFRIVLVGVEHGVGVPEEDPDRIVKYIGQKQEIILT